MPTSDQLKANISAMEAQGAPQADIQSYLDSFKGKQPPQEAPAPAPMTPPDPNSGVSAMQGTGADTAPLPSEAALNIPLYATDHPVVSAMKSTYNFLENMGVGIGRNIGKTGMGLGALPAEAAGYVLDKAGMPNTAKFANDVGATTRDLSKKIYDDPYNGNQGVADTVGNVIGAGAVLAQPSGIITKAQGGLESGLAKVGAMLPEGVKNIPVLSKALGYAGSMGAHVLPEMGLGFGYGKTMGETNDQAKNTALTFGAFSGLGKAAGDIYGAVKGTIQDNVVKALGLPKKMTVANAKEAIPNSIAMLDNIRKTNEGSPIMIQDAQDITRAWNPTKDGYPEFIQAFNQSKQRAFNNYTSNALKAGDTGVSFGASDYDQIVKALNDVKVDSTDAYVNRADSILSAIKRNFGVVVKNDGTTVVSQPTDLLRIQNFVQKLNKDVNPNVDSAGAEVAWKTTKAFRDILDSKISGATGEGYQAARTEYSQYLAMEKNVMDQFKKAVNNSGNKWADSLEKYGGIEAVVGLMTGGHSEMLRGAGLNMWGMLMKAMQDPTRNLQRAFSELSSAGTAENPLAVRALGSVMKTKPKVDIPKPEYKSSLITDPARMLPENALPKDAPTMNMPKESPSTVDARNQSVAVQGKQWSDMKNSLKMAPAGIPLVAPLTSENSVSQDQIDSAVNSGALTPDPSNKPMSKDEKRRAQGLYDIPDRKVTVMKKDLNLLGAVLYGEMSNTNNPDELRAIANTAINRMKYAKGNSMPGSRSLSEVLTEANQYQALSNGGNQPAKEWASGKASGDKKAVVEQILKEIADGTLKDTTSGKLFYTHLGDGISLSKTWKENRDKLKAYQSNN